MKLSSNELHCGKEDIIIDHENLAHILTSQNVLLAQFRCLLGSNLLTINLVYLDRKLFGEEVFLDRKFLTTGTDI